MKTKYKWNWGTLSLWRHRQYPAVCYVSGVSFVSTEATCLFSLRFFFSRANITIGTSTHGQPSN